jgi:hypothetical protein
LRRFYRLDDDEEEPRPRPGPDYARGEVLFSSSDESEGDSDEQQDEAEQSSSDAESEAEQVTLGRRQRRRRASSEISVDLDEEAGNQARSEDDQGTSAASVTRRLAIVNLDWDHVRAIDIYKALSSVLSPTAPDAALLPPPVLPNLDKGENVTQKVAARIAKGRLLSVTILPSEFGKERVAREDVEGPPREIFKQREDSDDDEDEDEIDETTILQEDEGAEYDDRALRKYQLERLRYVIHMFVRETSITWISLCCWRSDTTMPSPSLIPSLLPRMSMLRLMVPNSKQRPTLLISGLLLQHGGNVRLDLFSV